MDYKALYEQQLAKNKKLELTSKSRLSKLKKLQEENEKLKQEALDDHKKLREYAQRVCDKFGREEAEPLEPQYYETCDECNTRLSIDTPINIFEHPKKDETICVCSWCGMSMYSDMKKKGWKLDTDEDED